MTEIIYKELSYEVVGVLYEVYNEMGYGYKEIHYERAIAKGLEKRGIKYKRQAKYRITCNGDHVGYLYLDFVIEDKLILEIKKGQYFSRHNIEQVNQYLVATGKKLAILANFTPKGVQSKRLVNIKPVNC